MLIVIALQRPSWPSQGARSSLPWSAWIGGLFGAIYIVLAIALLPRLGAASLIALVVAGQMLASAVFDHFGLLGLAQHPATPSRLLGAVLIVAGVVLIRRGARAADGNVIFAHQDEREPCAEPRSTRRHANRRGFGDVVRSDSLRAGYRPYAPRELRVPCGMRAGVFRFASPATTALHLYNFKLCRDAV
jgi:hypothetical protein